MYADFWVATVCPDSGEDDGDGDDPEGGDDDEGLPEPRSIAGCAEA